MSFDDEHEKIISAFPYLTFDEEAAQLYCQSRRLDDLYREKNVSA